jgi:tetratricopeptide (TPR) repeat protein
VIIAMTEPSLPLVGAPAQAIEPTAVGAPLRGKGIGPPSVPDHELFQRIGSGAYGEVWLARNLATGAPRAVKIVYRSTFADERPFNREFEGIKKFDIVSRTHPSQLALFHVGRNDAAGYFYYVMELADAMSSEGAYQGHTLRADLGHGRLPAARVLEIALPLTEALAHLHANALIHRDVKPSNIIFVGGRPKLADIGLVTDASDSRSIVGTEGYLPPEGPGTPAADIFALGKVLYEISTGMDRRCFPELPQDLRSWPDRRAAIEVNEIVLRACAKEPALRYQTAEAMLAELKLLDAGKSVKRRRSAKRAWAWTWKAAVIVALLGLTFQIYQKDRAQRAALKRRNASPFEQSGTTNFAAWEAEQRGGTMLNRFTVTGLSNSIQEFEHAVALDPNYARAWAHLSASLFLSVEKGTLPGSEALKRALNCAEKASKLDPANGRPLYWIGECSLALDYDFGHAEPILRRAVKLSPNDWALRHNLAHVLCYYGRFDEAEAILKPIILEQPSRGFSHEVLGLIYASRHRFADALNAFEKCILLEPNWPETLFERAELLWTLNRQTEAVRDWLNFVEMDGTPSLNHQDAATLNTILMRSGPDQFLRNFIELLEQRRAQGNFVSAYDLARLHAQAGDKTRALDYLEQAVDEHRSDILSAKVRITFQDFQNEPRYHAVLRRLKLEK